jgi:hypothetical protein
MNKLPRTAWFVCRGASGVERSVSVFLSGKEKSLTVYAITCKLVS